MPAPGERWMPELPEVETIVRGLDRSILGRRITSVSIRDRSVIRGVSGGTFARRVRGGAVESVQRRGKYILLRLDNQVDLIIHLRMTGQLLIGAGDWDRDADATSSALHAKVGAFRKEGGPRKQIDRSASVSSCSPPGRDPYVRVRLRLDDGRTLAFRDVRKLGEIRVVPRGEYGSIPGLAGLGPEPLGKDLSPGRLAEALAGRRAPVKTLLMDQRLVAGVGNIYASEILYAVGIDPRRAGGSLQMSEIRALRRAASRVLRAAIRDEGTTFRDYRGPGGRKGGYRPRVYGRAGEPCRRCRAVIQRVAIGGRSTYFCPRCQK